MTKFERSKPAMNSSLALWRFRLDQKEINEYYWTGRLASVNLKYLLSKLADNDDPVVGLNAPTDPFGTKIGSSALELKGMERTGSRWRRLTVVMLIASALERYTVGVAEVAFRSDPTLAAGFPKKLDGLLLEEYGLNVNSRSTTGLIKGSWPSRIAAYEDAFGKAPDILTDSISTLEKMRKYRNTIAHEFGLDGDTNSSTVNLALGARRPNTMADSNLMIGDTSIMSFLASANSAARAIDEHLIREFIGDYELASLFIAWKKDPSKFESEVKVNLVEHNKSHEVRFRKMISELLGKRFGKEYISTLETFVKRL